MGLPNTSYIVTGEFPEALPKMPSVIRTLITHVTHPNFSADVPRNKTNGYNWFWSSLPNRPYQWILMQFNHNQNQSLLIQAGDDNFGWGANHIFPSWGANIDIEFIDPPIWTFKTDVSDYNAVMWSGGFYPVEAAKNEILTAEPSYQVIRCVDPKGKTNFKYKQNI